MKFYLNNKEINVLNGTTFSIKKDETLDSGSIELVFSDSDEPILPMSEIRIEDNNETYNFLVSKDIVEVASKQPKTYLHKIDFVQNTRKFSKIQVRNTQFSQPAKNSLKCGMNNTFRNTSIDYMKAFGDGYSYTMEISKKHKIKNAHFKINTMYMKFDSSFMYDEYLTRQDTCPKLSISFDIYKDNELLFTQSGTYSNNDIVYLDRVLEDGAYTIKNIQVSSLSSLSTNELFFVGVSLICDVYYYSLYDVLDILRKQIALKETSIEALSSPNIVLTSKYSSDNKNYNIYATIKNTNNVNTIATYRSEGGITLSKQEISIAAKNSITINLGTMSEGNIYFYSYLNNESKTIKSLIKEAKLSLDEEIIAPTLSFVEDSTSAGYHGYKYKITNINKYACDVYVKAYEVSDSSKPEEYTKIATIDSNESYESALFIMTKLFVECYLVKVNNEDIKSDVANNNIFIPPVSYEYELYLSTDGESGSYSLKQVDQLQTDVEYTNANQMWRYIEDNNLYDLSAYSFNSVKSYVDGFIIKLYGYNYITWTLTVNYYLDSVLKETRTYVLKDNSAINPSSYERKYGGYKFNTSEPTSSFILNNNKTLNMYYVVDSVVHDYRFNNRVLWDDVYYAKSGDITLTHTLISETMVSDYESDATYSVYDPTTGEYLDNITNIVSVEKSTGVVSGDTTHNNALTLVEDYGG